MVQTYLHVRVTLDSSVKQRVEELAMAARRSTANYVRVLIERDLREKDTQHEA